MLCSSSRLYLSSLRRYTYTSSIAISMLVWFCWWCPKPPRWAMMLPSTQRKTSSPPPLHHPPPAIYRWFQRVMEKSSSLTLISFVMPSLGMQAVRREEDGFVWIRMPNHISDCTMYDVINFCLDWYYLNIIRYNFNYLILPYHKLVINFRSKGTKVISIGVNEGKIAKIE